MRLLLGYENHNMNLRLHNCGRWVYTNKVSTLRNTNSKSILCSINGLRELTTSSRSHDALKLPSTSPENIKRDWIGPPDIDSNIRPVAFHIPPNETNAEKEFREKREDVQRWNHEFWAKHNRKFSEDKAAFIKKYKGVKYRKPNAEELAEFYSMSLDGNSQLHRMYNWEWYKKNIALLWPALKVIIMKPFVKR